MDCYKLPKIGPSHTLHAYSGSPQRWLVDAQMLRIRTPPVGPGLTRASIPKGQLLPSPPSSTHGNVVPALGLWAGSSL
jgi:hypothetical protein